MAHQSSETVVDVNFAEFAIYVSLQGVSKSVLDDAHSDYSECHMTVSRTLA